MSPYLMERRNDSQMNSPHVLQHIVNGAIRRTTCCASLLTFFLGIFDGSKSVRVGQQGRGQQSGYMQSQRAPGQAYLEGNTC